MDTDGATDLVPSGYNKTLETLRLNPFNSQFNTSYYEGLHRLLGGLESVAGFYCFAGGYIEKNKGIFYTSSLLGAGYLRL